MRFTVLSSFMSAAMVAGGFLAFAVACSHAPTQDTSTAADASDATSNDVADAASDGPSDGARDAAPVDAKSELPPGHGCGWDVADIEHFDKCAKFQFAVFSDNKGDGPLNKYMANMMKGVKDMGARFVLGLGDHVKSSSHGMEPFVALLHDDAWWHDNFYPTIADGENQYYGSGQGDWGAGKGLMEENGVCERDNVKCRDNHVEYHAVWNEEGVEVHFITAHYPDTGTDPFPKSSQKYLVDEVKSIKRDKPAIVIVAAHTGNWLKKMSEEDQQVLLDKADLLLGATTHVYTRYKYPDDKALFLNTGSVSHAGPLNNYFQVSVFDNPLRIIVQNMSSMRSRGLRSGGNCWVKPVGGKITRCQFTHAP